MSKIKFFNWDKVIRAGKYDHYKILDIFSSFAKKPVPLNLAGNSFILNIKGFADSKYYDSEKFDYIMLAALRNYFDYEYQANSGLWLPVSPIDTVKISKNRLLRIEDNYIQFKYEKED